MDESIYDPPQQLETRYDRPGVDGKGYGHDYWLEGKSIVTKRAGAKLPDRCIKCNGPRSGKRIRTRLFWHPAWVYGLILLNPLIYFMMALHVRLEASVALSLCRRHRNIQKIKSHLGYGLLLLTLSAFAAPFVGIPESWVIPVVLLALLGLMAVAVWAAWVAPIVRAARIQDANVWIAGSCADYRKQMVADNFVSSDGG